MIKGLRQRPKERRPKERPEQVAHWVVERVRRPGHQGGVNARGFRATKYSSRSTVTETAASGVLRKPAWVNCVPLYASFPKTDSKPVTLRLIAIAPPANLEIIHMLGDDSDQATDLLLDP